MLYADTIFIDDIFLGFSRAVESYHRETTNNEAMSSIEFERRLNLVVDGVGEKKVKKWIKGRLAHANEPSLETRFREILERFKNLIPLEDDKRKRLAKSIADARNDLTHPGNRSQRALPTNEQLYHYGEQLRFLMELCLLGEIGFSDGDLSKAMERKRAWKGARWPWG